MGLIAAAAAGAGIHEEILSLGGSDDPRAISSGHPLDLAQQTKTSIKSNKEMEGIVEIVKSLEDSGLLIKGISQTTENDTKEQRIS